MGASSSSNATFKYETIHQNNRYNEIHGVTQVILRRPKTSGNLEEVDAWTRTAPENQDRPIDFEAMVRILSMYRDDQNESGYTLDMDPIIARESKYRCSVYLIARVDDSPLFALKDIGFRHNTTRRIKRVIDSYALTDLEAPGTSVPSRPDYISSILYSTRRHLLLYYYLASQERPRLKPAYYTLPASAHEPVSYKNADIIDAAVDFLVDDPAHLYNRETIINISSLETYGNAKGPLVPADDVRRMVSSRCAQMMIYISYVLRAVPLEDGVGVWVNFVRGFEKYLTDKSYKPDTRDSHEAALYYVGKLQAYMHSRGGDEDPQRHESSYCPYKSGGANFIIALLVGNCNCVCNVSVAIAVFEELHLIEDVELYACLSTGHMTLAVVTSGQKENARVMEVTYRDHIPEYLDDTIANKCTVGEHYHPSVDVLHFWVLDASKRRREVFITYYVPFLKHCFYLVYGVVGNTDTALADVILSNKEYQDSRLVAADVLPAPVSMDLPLLDADLRTLRSYLKKTLVRRKRRELLKTSYALRRHNQRRWRYADKERIRHTTVSSRKRRRVDDGSYASPRAKSDDTGTDTEAYTSTDEADPFYIDDHSDADISDGPGSPGSPGSPGGPGSPP